MWQQSRRAFSSLRTPLYDLHVNLKGKMVDFAGYSMPVQYTEGIVQSHLHTRTANCASLFDVSHMGQVRIYGKDRVSFMEKLVVGDIESLNTGEAKLSLLTTPSGGIMDDCVITAYEDHLYVVVNAGNKAVDLKHMRNVLEYFSGDATIDYVEDQALIALQGPGAADVLSSHVKINLSELSFMSGIHTNVDGETSCIVTRCGYTGEDGFEISVPAEKAVVLSECFLQDKRVLPAGLGARDSLRLEAGLCLHGHDIDTSTTPIEAALTWTIGKRRREEGGFPGAETILDQLKFKSNTKKRVGFTMSKGPPAREGAEIYNANDELVGKVTSGTMSPMLKTNIGMAYINRGFFKLGTELKVKVRNKFYDMKIQKMPFVPTNYYQK